VEQEKQNVHNRCIIVGSGSSLREGVSLGLIPLLKNEVVFSLNDNIRFFKPTVAVFGDWTAYRDRFKLFSNHPLTIGRFDMHIGRTIEGATPCPKHDSLILLQGSGKYHGDEGLSKGLYSAVLTGAFTLNLAIRLGFKEIYLLGFDNCAINGQTHWYQNVEGAGQFTDYEGKPYTGVGKKENGEYNTAFYNKDDVQLNLLWEPFQIEMDKVKIYNVSPQSRISVFPKIDYSTLICALFPQMINQEEAQKEIRQLLEPYNKLVK
jgi:hypothetical protein